MSPFQDKREPLMSLAYFNETATLIASTIQRFEDNLSLHRDKLKKPQVLTYSVFKYWYQLLISNYSRGDDLGTLEAIFGKMVDALERHQEEAGERALVFEDDISDYTVALWLVSLAQLLHVPASLRARLVQCIGNRGKDALYEQLVNPAGSATEHGLIYPKPYITLWEAIQDDTAQAQARIRHFLQRWYEELDDAYWHESHKGPDGGGFFGYWAIEAAGVAVAFGIDDSSFRDMPYYPKDLADFGRSMPGPGGSHPSTE